MDSGGRIIIIKPNIYIILGFSWATGITAAALLASAIKARLIFGGTLTFTEVMGMIPAIRAIPFQWQLGSGQGRERRVARRVWARAKKEGGREGARVRKEGEKGEVGVEGLS